MQFDEYSPFPSLSLSLSLVSKEAISSDGDKVSATRSPRIIEGRFSFRGDARCGALNWREDVSLARALISEARADGKARLARQFTF